MIVGGTSDNTVLIWSLANDFYSHNQVLTGYSSMIKDIDIN
jgi:hypothetical protein